MSKTTVSLPTTAKEDSAQFASLNAHQTDVVVMTGGATADIVTYDDHCSYIEISSPVGNTGPIFVRAGSKGDATALLFDGVVLPGQSKFFAVNNSTETQFSILGVAAETAYVLQY